MLRDRIGVCLVVLAGAALILTASVGWAESQPMGAAKAPQKIGAFKPVQPIHDMMEGQKMLFTQIKEGIVDGQWKESSKAAWILAEIANVNQYQKDDPQYKRYAKQMSKDCVSLAKLLKKKDAAAAREGFRKVGRNCSMCHKKFRKDDDDED